jgi:deazaflavin-dependent oxidoreductase (nitroreductase family)
VPLPRPARILPRYLNPALRRVAIYLPPLAVLHHNGRRTATPYTIPVQAYRTAGGFLVAYAYSDHPQWAQKLLATGTGTLTRAGKHDRITNPRQLGLEGLHLLSAPVATLMRAIGVRGFLQFDTN